MLIDSHCHLDRVDLTPYSHDFARMMQHTQDAGVGHMLCVSINLDRYPTMLALVADYPQVSVSVGVHPNELQALSQDSQQLQDTLLKLAEKPKTVAIGETGLDYYRSSKDASSWQQQRFRAHIQAAKSCNKPLIVHSRQAPQDTLRILREEQADTVGGVIHCFTEDWETAKAALDLGFYISFSGIITFANANKLRAVARLIPTDRLLIETDCPYLTPLPQRGKNEPKFVALVAECLASLRGMAYDTLVEATGENFRRLFGLPPKPVSG